MNELLGFEASKSGEMYNDLATVFTRARQRAVKLTQQYNRLYGEDEEKRMAVLNDLLGSVGETIFLNQTFVVNSAKTFILAIASTLILTVFF
ncbi:maltose acetyltransferase domain-containing protein [Enterococcus devriesei]|uniref:maltose acetyltransferase domain-containing protein n=1 Tax=Enterococcus devriesei TaxID=319970 RepID=UPI001FEA25D3|nr:maltose acetyltransferase domain-containing protein [Enterococcus devriesei]MDT2820465.1 maltose acetyltransferase domain-containing protein [Enterococcus devriesei]